MPETGGSGTREMTAPRGATCGGMQRKELPRRMTPHGLLHTANNELRRVANGEVVRAIIGHATEAMTHHYSHVGEDEKREEVDDRLLE